MYLYNYFNFIFIILHSDLSCYIFLFAIFICIFVSYGADCVGYFEKRLLKDSVMQLGKIFWKYNENSSCWEKKLSLNSII